MTVDVGRFAARLHRSRIERTPVAMLTADDPPLTRLGDAYAVASAGIDLRREAGELVVGGKLGFTSNAMRTAMGVDAPNYGWITDAMVVHDGLIDAGSLIHPKIEPEIAFFLDHDLDPPVTVADVMDATWAVMPCLEVVDSRYQNFSFRALDNVADNSSAGLVVLGDPVPLTTSGHGPLDLARLGVVVTADGAHHATAAGAAALDHPASAVAWMANHASDPLQAGHIVISGGGSDTSRGPVDGHRRDRRL